MYGKDSITAKILSNGKSSWGNNPAFPNNDGLSIIELLENEYNIAYNGREGIDPVTELSETIAECAKIELPATEMVERACDNDVTEIFDIPKGSITIVTSLHQLIDKSGSRTNPEKFNSEDIDFDLDKAKEEIYKRRVLLSICAGAASLISSQKKLYNGFGEISKELPALYSKINALRRMCIYTDSIKYSASNNGQVSVTIGDSEFKPVIKAEGSCAPFLVEMIIRGILELSISTSLPKDHNMARYILGKSDFSMAEKFDIMIGIPLWKRIAGCVESAGYNMGEIGPNFILMELSKLDFTEFNRTISSLIEGSGESVENIGKICAVIKYGKDYDNFNDFIEKKSMTFRIDDNQN